MPAALVLPAGKFFFGYKYVPFDSKAEEKRKKAKEGPAGPAPQTSFQGQGNSLRRGATATQPAPSAAPPAPEAEDEKPDPWANLGGGQTLSGRKRRAATPPVEVPQPTRQEVIDATMLDEDDFMFDDTYSDGDDDDDIIEVDSD